MFADIFQSIEICYILNEFKCMEAPPPNVHFEGKKEINGDVELKKTLMRKVIFEKLLSYIITID